MTDSDIPPSFDTIHISGDGLHQTVERQLGKLNVGLSCLKCGEFIAFAVIEKVLPRPVRFASDGPFRVECWSCQTAQSRRADEIEVLLLTSRNIRKTPTGKDIH